MIYMQCPKCGAKRKGNGIHQFRIRAQNCTCGWHRDPYPSDPQDGKEKKMDSIETIQKKHREGVEYVETALAVEAIEKAREEERCRCLAEIKYELIDTPADRFDSVHNSAVKDCLFAIETLGPISSIEERIRRETVEKVKTIIQREPTIDCEVTNDLLDNLDRIAEGGEG